MIVVRGICSVVAKGIEVKKFGLRKRTKRVQRQVEFCKEKKWSWEITFLK